MFMGMLFWLSVNPSNLTMYARQQARFACGTDTGKINEHSNSKTRVTEV